MRARETEREIKHPENEKIELHGGAELPLRLWLRCWWCVNEYECVCFCQQSRGPIATTEHLCHCIVSISLHHPLYAFKTNFIKCVTAALKHNTQERTSHQRAEHKRCAPASGGEFAAAAKRGIFEYQKTIHDKHSIKKNIDKLSPKAV
jgi:hypothetical protein